jgi:hypothetical protein
MLEQQGDETVARRLPINRRLDIRRGRTGFKRGTLELRRPHAS